MKKIVRKGLGVVCIVVGLVALFTPLTPGSWLVPIGLELIGIRLLVERGILRIVKPQHREKMRAFFRKLPRLKRKRGEDQAEP